MKNNILIIGGSGFVGTCLINRLGCKSIFNFDKNPSKLFSKITTIGNVLDKSALEDNLKNIQTVVLLAAEHRDDVYPISLYYDVNVQGTKNVLEAMDKNNVKNIVFTSSVAVYGLNKKNPNEKSKIDPFNHYGKSKWQAENLIKEWYESDKDLKSITIIRPTVIFGENNRGNVYNLFKQISSGNFLMIGDGNNQKSIAYVENVVSFIITIIEKLDLGMNLYNYVDKPDINMNELYSIVSEKMNIKKRSFKIPYILGLFIGYFFDFISFLIKKNFSISSVRVKKFCATTIFSASKAAKFFKPKFTLKQAINRTIEYEFINKK